MYEKGDIIVLEDGTKVEVMSIGRPNSSWARRRSAETFTVRLQENIIPPVANSTRDFWSKGDTFNFYCDTGEWVRASELLPGREGFKIPLNNGVDNRFYVGSINKNGELVSHAADNL